MTGQEYINKCKADLCKTQSRSKNGKNYHNKYTEYFGKLGYPGINKNGVFTKRYKYGVVGHCCIGAQYHLYKNGLHAFVPHFTSGTYKFIWNTGVYHKWLKSEPTIKGYGKVDWVTKPSKAKPGAIAFTPSHTCVFIKYANGYVYTVDFNVSDGKGHNNGVCKKRKASKFSGFANIPYPVKYKVVTKSSPLNLRKEGKAKATVIGKIPKDTVVYVTSIKNGFAYIPSWGGYCSASYLQKV